MKKIIVITSVLLLAATTNVVLITDAEAQARPRSASTSSTKSNASAKPRQDHRQSMGSRARTRAATPLAPRQATQNVDKAAQRQSSGHSSTSIAGSRTQPTMSAATPGGSQKIAVAPPPPTARASQGVDVRARPASQTRTTASGKTTTMTSSATK